MPGFELTGFRHQVGVVWLWLAASDGVFGPVDRVLSAREMEGLDRAARRLGGADRPAIFGTHLLGADGSVAGGLAYPDLRLEVPGGRVAAHLELRVRPRGELERLLYGYAAAEPLINVALFMVDDMTVGRAILGTASRLGLSDLVSVQSATIARAEPEVRAAAS